MIPATVLTGWLGAGKTTLLNHILSNRSGWKAAIIVNEFGDIAVDNRLVVSSEEDMITFNSGCVCCKIRGDLIQTIHKLLREGEKWDAILIETTGIADPGPIAQSFMMDDDLKEKVRLDAVVTVVDAKHFKVEGEAREQIAFADVVLLNKTDLAELSRIDQVEADILGINALAKIHRTKNSEIALDKILDIHAYDPANKPEPSEHPHGNSDIRTVSLSEKGMVDGKKLNTWLGKLLMRRGQDIFRTKGIFQVKGVDRRVVFQAVHMTYNGGPDREWGPDEDRTNVLVFIGRNLPEEELRAGLRDCLA